MTSTPEPVDERLLAASDLARAALLEVTPESSIGEPVGYLDEGDGVVSLRFANRLAGYPGWFWTVSLARVDDADPTVLEVELLPGDQALLAPEWVPWAVRLAEYQAAQNVADSADATGGDVDDEDDAEDDLDDDEIDDVLGDDLDDDELDDDGSPILHAGDVDGVDIDELDPSAPDDDDDDVDSDDDDDEDSDDDSDDDEDSDDDSDEDDDDSEDDDSDDDDSDDDSDEDDGSRHDD